MYRFTAATVLCAFSLAAASKEALGTAQAAPWINQSNVYTMMLFDVQLEHSPEEGSQQGLAKFDRRISDPTLADELAQRRELEAVMTKLKTAQTTETDKRVQDDLEILRKALDLRFRQEDFAMLREVPFINASEIVF